MYCPESDRMSTGQWIQISYYQTWRTVLSKTDWAPVSGSRSLITRHHVLSWVGQNEHPSVDPDLLLPDMTYCSESDRMSTRQWIQISYYQTWRTVLSKTDWAPVSGSRSLITRHDVLSWVRQTEHPLVDPDLLLPDMYCPESDRLSRSLKVDEIDQRWKITQNWMTISRAINGIKTLDIPLA